MVSIVKIEDDAALTTHLVKHLQPLTEADPNILAKYVLALLKNNKPKAELQAFCTEKLVDFLGEDSKTFVVNLFHALENGTISARPEELDSKMEDGSVSMPAISLAIALSIGENVELKSSSHLQKHSEANNRGVTDREEEFSDDEDDDRNHKHRRRMERSRSLDRDTQDGPLPKLSRSDYDKPTEEFHRGPSFLENNGLPKRRSGRDHLSEAASRLGTDTNEHSLSRGASMMRSDGPGSRFEHQNGLSRGFTGRGRGGSPFILASREHRAPVDPSDSNALMLSPGLSKNLYAVRSNSSRGGGNSSHSSWLGYNLFTGMLNGTLDHPLPLNAGIPGSRGVSMSSAVGIGMNIGVGMALRPRCPDFEERGYCLRGDLCPMEHGANRIVVEDVQSLSKFNLPVVLPSGRAMAGGTAPVSSTSLTYSGISNIATRDVNSSALTDSGYSKVVSVTEPDLYDPDQPLWNNEPPDPLVDSLRKLPPFTKDSESESAALERSQRQSPGDEAYGKLSVAMSKPQALGGSAQSVWNRIGRLDKGDTKDGSFPLVAEPSLESLQSQNAFKKEAHGSLSFSGKRKIDSEERTIRISKGTSGKGGGHNTLEREPAVYKTHEVQGARFPSDKAQNTLFVGCLPRDPNRKELLVAHFQKFGDIVDIRVPPHGERAFVQFLRREDAEAALTSPKAVMGNRFIRLAWAKRDNIPISSMESTTVLPPMAQGSNAGCVDIHGMALDNSVSDTGKKTIDSLFEVNKNKQASQAGTNLPLYSAQKKQEELEHVKETIEAIRKRREELDRKRDEFRRQLERFSKQDNDTASELDTDSLRGSKEVSLEQTSNEEEKEGSDGKSIHKQTSIGHLLAEKVLSTSDQDLRKDFAKQTLGLLKGSLGSLSQQSPKGLRSHSVWPNSGGVGSQRSSSRYKIDNRTTIFQVLSPLPESLLDATILKHHFQFFGDVVNVEMEDLDQQGDLLSSEKITAKVTFSTRSVAEKAYMQGKWFQGTPLQFSWFNSSPNASVTASSETLQVEGKKRGLIKDEGVQGQSSQTLISASGNGSDAEGRCEMNGQLESITGLGTVLEKISEEGQKMLQG